MKIFIKKITQMREEEYAKRLANGILHTDKLVRVCEYYIIDQDKKTRDVWDLSTKELACIIMNSKEFEITKYINDKQKINDYVTLKEIMEFKKYCNKKESISLFSDVIGALGGNKLLSKVKEFVEYEKNINGKEISLEQMVDNLANLEQSKENQNF